MRDPQAEIWLARQRIEYALREAARRAELPARQGWLDALRLQVGEALIASGHRLLPGPRRSPARAT